MTCGIDLMRGLIITRERLHLKFSRTIFISEFVDFQSKNWPFLKLKEPHYDFGKFYSYRILVIQLQSFISSLFSND